MIDKDDLLKIDLAHLEIDAAGQARLMRQWTTKLAKAEREAKSAKNRLRVTLAQLRRLVRSTPTKYGIHKINEDAVMDAVVVMSTYKEAESALIEAEENRDILKAMVSALHERGEQIGNEVKLFGQQYWAKPQTSGDFKKGFDEEERIEEMQAMSPKKRK